MIYIELDQKKFSFEFYSMNVKNRDKNNVYEENNLQKTKKKN